MRSASASPVEIVAAKHGDMSRLASLLDDYLGELRSHCSAGASDAAGYRWFRSYWAEAGRHPFLFLSGGEPAGFAFIRDARSTGVGNQVAEFYVVPRFRRRGIGRGAILALWSRFPGEWELQVHVPNTAAVAFWMVCTELAAGEAPEVQELDADDGPRLQLNFRV